MEAVHFSINKRDLEEYYKTLSNKCRIRKIRARIFKNMPSDIKDEFRQKMNDLVCTDEEKGIYEIVAKEASESLKNYLKNFIFYIEKNENSI